MVRQLVEYEVEGNRNYLRVPSGCVGQPKEIFEKKSLNPMTIPLQISLGVFLLPQRSIYVWYRRIY